MSVSDVWNGTELRIGRLRPALPIVQGGMGVGVSLAGLAAAVANAGGVGVISAAGIGMFEPDFFANFLAANARALRREIRKARALTQGILGINIMVALSNFAEMVTIALEEGIDIIFSGAGLPLNLPHLLQGHNRTALVPIVSSARAARLICERWIAKYGYAPAAIVVEGPLAGGHLGFKMEQIADPAYALENLLPAVIAAVSPLARAEGTSIPAIAAGGIFTGADIHKFLQLGAAGVQMATRFVATHECDASLEFKRAYLNAREEDIVIIKSPVGMPGRAIRNSFLDDVTAGKKKPFSCPCHCIKTCDYENSPYCICLALVNAQKGRLRHGFAFAGQNAYRVNEIVSVSELIHSLTEEYAKARRVSQPCPLPSSS